MKFKTNAASSIAVYIFIAGSLSVASCQSVPPVQYTMSRLNNRYTGLEAKDFFYQYGLPAGKTSSDNGRSYSWITPPPNMKVNETSETQSVSTYREESESMYRAHDNTIHETKTVTVRTVSTPETTTLSDEPGNDSDYITSAAKAKPPVAEWENEAGPYCQLEIQVNARDIIEHITLVNDSMGKRSASRCSELFATPSLL